MTRIPSLAHILSLSSVFLSVLAPSAVAQDRHFPPQPGQRHPPIRRHPPRRPLIRTESTRVKAGIVDGVANTVVTMRFRNDGARVGEKVVLFPLPRGASADEIQMEVGGRMEKGEVLDRNKARRIYESIVSRRRDPALLEYMGRDLLRLRVFPIPPRGSQTVQVRFRMILPEAAGLFGYEFPTRAVEGGSFALDVAIRSSKAIKNVYSPIAGFDVSRKDDYNARASFECRGRPKRDPILFYGLSDRDFGLNLLTYRPKGQGENPGYFLLMIAPKRDWKDEAELRKSITFVLDTSGSMQGKKIQQAKGALRFFLQSLKKTDRFNIIPFSTEARPFANSPVAADEAGIQKALDFTAGLEARGGTNIHEAMMAALSADPAEGLVPMLVFLTDGQPTIGVTDMKQILDACTRSNKSRARVFVFGVGNDVNTHLLDRMSADSGGTRDYVRQDESIEVKMSALFEKLAHPVMNDVELVVDKLGWSRLAPSKLPDLFRGTRLVVAGRYTGSGHVAIRLRGKASGKPREHVFEAEFPAHAQEHDFVATIWAQRRIGQLLDAIRLKGQNPELVAEVTRLGKEHGVVTPYTSHLIVEEGDRVALDVRRVRGLPATPAPLPRESLGRVMRELESAGALEGKSDSPQGLRDIAKKLEGRGRKKAKAEGERKFGRLGNDKAGADAVDESTTLARITSSGRIAGKRSGLIRSQRVHGRNFHLVASIWVDSAYKASMEKNLRKIRAFSPEYFELLKKRPELARFLSFSTAMILVTGKAEAIEILPPKE